MSEAFAITGGRVVLPDRVVDADLVIENGVVSSVGDDGRQRSMRSLDASGMHVLAGMIDTHVHLREPGHPHRENFSTGTMAAAAGGTTTVLEMPGGVPPVSSARSWEEKRDLVSRHAYVDFGLYGGAGAENLDLIGEQASVGAVAFKSFMNHPAPNADPGSLTRCLPDDASFFEAMKMIAATGRVGVIHAENEDICNALIGQFRQGDPDALQHARSRPPVAEEEAVRRAIVLARAAGARISFAHLSTASAVQAVREAKAAGQPVTAEACPHHLLLTEQELVRLGPYAKMNPPLRDDADRAALWDALLDGTVDYIGTDHAPYTTEEKDRGWDNIFDAPSGVHGIQTGLELLLAEVIAGRITLPKLSQVVSLNAAKIFGLWPRKGEIRVGADADLVIVDMKADTRIDRSELISVTKDAARLWDGRRAAGRVRSTLVRGTPVYADGEIVAQAGHGRVISPSSIR